jgi:hypothetical protein
LWCRSLLFYYQILAFFEGDVNLHDRDWLTSGVLHFAYQVDATLIVGGGGGIACTFIDRFLPSSTKYCSSSLWQAVGAVSKMVATICCFFSLELLERIAARFAPVQRQERKTKQEPEKRGQGWLLLLLPLPLSQLSYCWPWLFFYSFVLFYDN